MKKTYTFIFFLFSLFILFSCKEDVKIEELAGPTAEQYYKYLLDGNYEAFVDGTWHEDSIRQSYRQELITNARMYVGQMNEQHQGIKGITLKAVENDTLRKEANVFFMMSFGDKTTEQIVVPMVLRDGIWYMR